MSRSYPIIEYAQKIGKNTAEFTTKDLSAFMKWYMTQKPRKDLLTVTPEQRKGYEKDLKAMNKFRDAQTSRLPADLIGRNIEEDREEDREEVVDNEIVVELGLTRIDIDALLWALNEIFENYELTGTPHNRALLDLQESLKGIE